MSKGIYGSLFGHLGKSPVLATEDDSSLERFIVEQYKAKRFIPWSFHIIGAKAIAELNEVRKPGGKAKRKGPEKEDFEKYGQFLTRYKRAKELPETDQPTTRLAVTEQANQLPDTE